MGIVPFRACLPGLISSLVMGRKEAWCYCDVSIYENAQPTSYMGTVRVIDAKAAVPSQFERRENK